MGLWCGAIFVISGCFSLIPIAIFRKIMLIFAFIFAILLTIWSFIRAIHLSIWYTKQGDILERGLKITQGVIGIFEIILCCVSLGIKDPDEAGEGVTYQQPLVQLQPQVITYPQPQVVAFQQPQVVAYQQPQVVNYQQPQMVAYQQPQVLQVQQPVEGVSGKPPTYPGLA